MDILVNCHPELTLPADLGMVSGSQIDLKSEMLKQVQHDKITL